MLDKMRFTRASKLNLRPAIPKIFEILIGWDVPDLFLIIQVKEKCNI